MMENEKKRTGSWKRTVLIVVCAVLAVVLAVLIFATAYVESFLNRINRDFDDSTLSSSEIDAILTGEATGTGPTVNAEDIQMGEEPTETIGGDEIINILLIGQDRREGQGRQRSDAMILCTINTGTDTLTMTSFLRDVYVKIPGYGNNKINASYQIGGMELLDACLEENFGIQVDANVEVDFNGFMELIDMMGGVNIELTADEAGYLNRRGNWDITGNDGWTLKSGVNTMSGSQALAYSRIRELGMDFERTERQRKVLTALIGKVQDQNLKQINDLVFKVAELITTDMSNSEITGYVAKCFPMLADLNIKTQRIPADGTYRFGDVGNVGDCIIIDFEENRKLLVDALMK